MNDRKRVEAVKEGLNKKVYQDVENLKINQEISQESTANLANILGDYKEEVETLDLSSVEEYTNELSEVAKYEVEVGSVDEKELLKEYSNQIYKSVDEHLEEVSNSFNELEETGILVGELNPLETMEVFSDAQEELMPVDTFDKIDNELKETETSSEITHLDTITAANENEAGVETQEILSFETQEIYESEIENTSHIVDEIDTLLSEEDFKHQNEAIVEELKKNIFEDIKNIAEEEKIEEHELFSKDDLEDELFEEENNSTINEKKSKIFSKDELEDEVSKEKVEVSEDEVSKEKVDKNKNIVDNIILAVIIILLIIIAGYLIYAVI